MDVRYRWAWFALATLTAASLAWTTRYQYEACDTDGCVAIHRWSGSITFRQAAWYEPPADVQVVTRSTPRRRGVLRRAALHQAAAEVP